MRFGTPVPVTCDVAQQQEATLEVLNTRETAEYLRLSKPTLERFRISGEGPSFCKLGGAVRYRKDDLDAWLESRRVRSTSEGDAK
jgi:excisionase family DNA binding protein